MNLTPRICPVLYHVYSMHVTITLDYGNSNDSLTMIRISTLHVTGTCTV